LVRLLAASSLAALAAASLSAPAVAAPAQLFPNVTYESSVQFTPHGPVAIHVVRGPRPTGLYRLRPVLSNESVVARETTSSMQKRMSPQATSVGVNGDYFAVADGRPSGIMIRDGVLVTQPNGARSSAGVMLDGTLDVRKISFRGTWRGTGPRRAVTYFNKAPGPNGMSLFSSDWGRTTPTVAGSFAVVLSPFPATAPNVDIQATVARTVENARVGISPGSAVLVARGTAAANLRTEAAVGTIVTTRLILSPDWAAVSDAIGGGPMLVQNGRPVYRSNEAFQTSQLAPRGPRSAVGQTADGSILFVTTDGRKPGYSVGMSNFELAQTLSRLGAVRGMGLDGGGSATMAFEGTVLNRPSDGRERSIANSLQLQYFGAYVPPPAVEVMSPNGDGVAETQSLAFKVVRQSDVTVTLTAPDGSIASQEIVPLAPGSYPVAFPPPPQDLTQQPVVPTPLAQGAWTLTVDATDDQGLVSNASRRFFVNSTLGFLRAPARVVLKPNVGGAAVIRWTQSRPARVRVTLETVDGVLLRAVANRRFSSGNKTVTWNGKMRNGKVAPSGSYLVRVQATNDLGVVALERSLRARFLAPKPKPKPAK
jgi:exopolysaccharide biosynthesis protein